MLPSSGLLHVYTSLRPEVLRFLTARLGEPALAEDAMQELWLRLESGATGPIANPRAYLYRAAQNVALDMIRTRRRRVVRDGAWAVERGDAGDEPVDPTPGADQQIVEREETARLAAAIAALPEAAGRAFRMHKFDGLSHAEIAARLGISRSGVEKHIAVAMVHLRRALKD
ncbi:MAG: sigma-70 family RNA polymerase sigma factor [Sphingomonas aquatilis]|uniref:RNA polymerase sigma factor n=1 Tax=Sphingomonas aquatilis TaxID=93063 RepID=UPI002F2FCE3C